MSIEKLFLGDCLEFMKSMEDNSIDFIVCDPPYGLKFMGKKWDHGIPGIEYWEEMFRICKPGSMLATFGGTRTFHRLACALEDAGWEIRDTICWLYGSGFPKSHNNFGLDGYGTCLKPAWEPILICMKSLDGTYKKNVEKWGIGGINIDKSRIPTNDTWKNQCQDIRSNGLMDKKGRLERFSESSSMERWPANLILDEESTKMLDELSPRSISKSGGKDGNSGWKGLKKIGRSGHDDTGGPSRFFYCAKASSRERNEGLEDMPLIRGGPERMNNTHQRKNEIDDSERLILTKNNHPTIKPIALMRYIITLLAPPNNPILLDPFMGSGSTLLAAIELGIDCIGIEKEDEYFEIAKKRIEFKKQKTYDCG